MFKERSKYVSVKRDKCNYRQVFNDNPDIPFEDFIKLYPTKSRKTLRDCWNNYRADIRLMREAQENMRYHKIAIAPPAALIGNIARPQ